jgi:nucleoside triphosphate diphosphatase
MDTPPTSSPKIHPPQDAGRQSRSVEAVARLVDLVARLRAPDGCSWDRALTRPSMAPNLIEEAHELVEAIDRGEAQEECEEAGDLLINLCLLCQIAAEEGRFDLGVAAQEAGDKLVRRHPHVFGAAAATAAGRTDLAPHDSASAALHQWEAIKRQERSATPGDQSVLAGIPKALPALQRAQRLGAKAIAAGFRWPDAHGALAKLEEELAEVSQVFVGAGALPMDALSQAELTHELGDLLLAAAQFANYVGIDAEAATRAAARRFERRLRTVEGRLGGRLEGRSLEELMAAWRAVKAEEGGLRG